MTLIKSGSVTSDWINGFMAFPLSDTQALALKSGLAIHAYLNPLCRIMKKAPAHAKDSLRMSERET
jgi:hypothetical protein